MSTSVHTTHCAKCVQSTCTFNHCSMVNCAKCGLSLHECKLEQHLSEICRFELVLCPMAWAGCTHKIQRGDFATHLLSCPANLVSMKMKWPDYDEFAAASCLGKDEDLEANLAIHGVEPHRTIQVFGRRQAVTDYTDLTERVCSSLHLSVARCPFRGLGCTYAQHFVMFGENMHPVIDHEHSIIKLQHRPTQPEPTSTAGDVLFSQLGFDIVEMITNHLDAEDLVSLATTCSQMRFVVNTVINAHKNTTIVWEQGKQDSLGTTWVSKTRSGIGLTLGYKAPKTMSLKKLGPLLAHSNHGCDFKDENLVRHGECETGCRVFFAP